ncbi:EamA family transporter [Candidatus Uhrbacteria bacterium]|nr:EamA family transporter [Candidatus Uhrbacteria bacterium]
MPSWIFIVIAAHLLNAFAFLVDKFLLVQAMPNPAVYAFSVGMLGAVAFLALPFQFVLPTGAQAVLDVAAGATFVAALLFFFTALKRGEASRIVPYVGGTIPVWTLIFAYLGLGERLLPNELLAFGILVVGSALIAREPAGGTRRRARGAYAIASLAAIAFALSTVLMKAVFETQPFLAGFVWSRAGAVIAAAALLLHPATRRAIFRRSERPSSRKSLGLFIGGQVAGAVGFLALQYAVNLASPTLVNALQGVQYAFLFAFVFFFGRRFPQFRERLTRPIVIQKIAALMVIAVGLALLAR